MSEQQFGALLKKSEKGELCIPMSEKPRIV